MIVDHPVKICSVTSATIASGYEGLHLIRPEFRRKIYAEHSFRKDIIIVVSDGDDVATSETKL